MVSTDRSHRSAEKIRLMRKGRPKLSLPLHFAIWNKLTVETRTLVEGGADVDAQDDYGRTPLMMCCMDNDEEWSTGIATMLLQAGANASLNDANGRNVLMFSLIFRRKRLTELLLKSKDYDLKKKDKSKRSALDYATMTGELPIFARKISQTYCENPVCRHNTSRRKSASLRPSKPSTVCTTIIKDTLTSAKVYAPSSDMNTHQFRRLVNGEIAAKHVDKNANKKRAPSRETKPKLTQGYHSRSNSISPRRPSTALSLRIQNECFTRDETKMRKIRPQSASWKSIVPLLWDTLSIQHCPSYRPPAIPVTQTFEEALGLPPIEDNYDESTVISGEDGFFQNDVEQTISRRSSMPTSHSSHPSYKLRRRSEAIGMSTNSVTKFFFSEKKIGDTFDQPVEVDQKIQEGIDATRMIPQCKRKQPEIPRSGDGDTVDSSTNENAVSNKSRSNLLPVKGKTENALNESTRRGSLPRSVAATGDAGYSMAERRRGSSNAASTIQKTNSEQDKPTSPQTEDYSGNLMNNGQSSPVRTQQLSNKKRRRDSILRDSAILPNIIEEQ